MNGIVEKTLYMQQESEQIVSKMIINCIQDFKSPIAAKQTKAHKNIKSTGAQSAHTIDYRYCAIYLGQNYKDEY